jgi:hypothetical protein
MIEERMVQSAVSKLSRGKETSRMGITKNHLLAVGIGACLGAATLGVMFHNILLWAAIGGALGVAYERRKRISR